MEIVLPNRYWTNTYFSGGGFAIKRYLNIKTAKAVLDLFLRRSFVMFKNWYIGVVFCYFVKWKYHKTREDTNLCKTEFKKSDSVFCYEKLYGILLYF